MPAVVLDHILTDTDATTLEDHLATYHAAGFVVMGHTVKHRPGLRTGFVTFRPEYIEFCWVEDEEAFAQGAAEHPELAAFRGALRPYGIGLSTPDVEAVHETWTRWGYSLPPIESFGPRDAEAGAPPAWSVQAIPDSILPGASCFALTYHRAPGAAAKAVQVAPNGIYALGGIHLVSRKAGSRAKHWQRLLAHDEATARGEGTWSFLLGAHRVTWVTPTAFERAFGHAWLPALHRWGELAVLDLLSEDLGRTERALRAAGRQTACLHDDESGEDVLVVMPDPHDGFEFAVRELPLDEYLSWRMARTGEALEAEIPA